HAVIKANQQLRIGGIVYRRVAQCRHPIGDQLRIMPELDPSGECRVVGNDGEGLPGWGRELRFEPRHVRAERGGASSEPGERQWHQRQLQAAPYSAEYAHDELLSSQVSNSCSPSPGARLSSVERVIKQPG